MEVAGARAISGLNKGVKNCQGVEIKHKNSGTPPG